MMTEISEKIISLRREYAQEQLVREKLDEDPVIQFGIWMNKAVTAQVNEPNGMTLSTVNAEGKPASRVVLLRGFDEKGFRFFTNYNSRKGKEISDKPFVALLFYWPELEKQVRLEGRCEKLSTAESEDYFHSRPRESQLGAWASKQSDVLKSREEFEQEIKVLEKKYEGSKVPCPLFWGGYIVKPDYFEFWQGRVGRLHDRFNYCKTQGSWQINRLYP